MRLSEKDVEALKTFPVEVEDALPEYDCRFPVVKYGSESRAVHTLGVVPETLKMRNFKVARGGLSTRETLMKKEESVFWGQTFRSVSSGTARAMLRESTLTSTESAIL